jgi:hypothetical protein
MFVQRTEVQGKMVGNHCSRVRLWPFLIGPIPQQIEVNNYDDQKNEANDEDHRRTLNLVQKRVFFSKFVTASENDIVVVVVAVEDDVVVVDLVAETSRPRLELLGRVNTETENKLSLSNTKKRQSDTQTNSLRNHEEILRRKNLRIKEKKRRIKFDVVLDTITAK